MTPFRPVRPEEAWRARVTEDDIQAARNAWWDAYEGGGSPARVAELWDDLVRLFRAEAEQVARGLGLPRTGPLGQVPRPHEGTDEPGPGVSTSPGPCLRPGPRGGHEGDRYYPSGPASM